MCWSISINSIFSFHTRIFSLNFTVQNRCIVCKQDYVDTYVLICTTKRFIFVFSKAFNYLLNHSPASPLMVDTSGPQKHLTNSVLPYVPQAITDNRSVKESILRVPKPYTLHNTTSEQQVAFSSEVKCSDHHPYQRLILTSPLEYSDNYEIKT